MRKSYNVLNTAASLFAASLIVFSVGCSKSDSSDPSASNDQAEPSKIITNKGDKIKIDKAIARLPGIAIYNKPSGKYILLDPNSAKDGFNFASSDASFSFSTPDESLTFVQDNDGNYYQVFNGSEGTDLGGGGGVVTAGTTSLTLNYVVCFNSGDDYFGGDLFGAGDGFSGFSGAIGLAGDFESLANGDFDDSNDDPFDFIQGFAGYYVFDGSPNGVYDVTDFFEAENESDSALDGLGLAYIFSFQGNGALYFSVDGSLTFGGSTASFDGTYAGLLGFTIGFGEDGDFADEDPSYVEVDGSGSIFCN